MTKTLQLKRGTKKANDSYTGAIAELTYDTESKELRVHDGVTQGGKVVGGLTSVSWNDLTDKPTIPSKTSQLTNDSNFINTSEATTIANNSASNAVTNHNGNSNAHSNIITPIKNVIPSAATASNQLADKKWVQSTLESFAGIIYKVKGSVATYNDLPQNAQPGDVYNVTDTGANYVYVDYADTDSSKSTDIGETVVNVSNQYALLSKFDEWGTTQHADITHLTIQKTSAEATNYTVKYYWMASDQEGEDPTEHSQTLNNISTNVLGNWGITITTFDATTVLAITRNKLGWDKLSETFELDALKQKSTLPTASLTELGKIYQYTGTTDANYTHGYVYECVETLAPYDITTSGTFSDPNLTIDEDIFLSYVQPSGDTVLTFTWDTSLTPPGWKLNNERVNVYYYGISFRSLPANGDTLIVTYTAPHSNNPKTYGWERVNIQPADTDSGSFVATYGTTTYNEITAALNLGKQCYCDYNGRRYYYTCIDNNSHCFVSNFRMTHKMIYVYKYDDTWTSGDDTWMETTSNKTTTVTASSTNTQYPSAKAVYDLTDASYPLVRTTVENNKVNHLVANTDSSNNIVSYQKQADGYSLTIMTLFDRLSIGTNNAGSLDNFPYEFPGTITYEVNDQMLFAPSYNGATNNGSISEKMLGYYDGEGIFIPVIIIDAFNAIYTNENKSCFWSKEVSEYTTSFKLGKTGDITHITLPSTSSDPAGDAGESWFYVMKGNSDRNFSFHICDGSYWHTLSASDLHLDEDFANKITTCMYNVYLYQTGPALTSESVIAYKCLTTAQANQSSNVNRGTNIFTKPISGGNTTSTSISLDGLKNMLGGLTFWTGTQTEYDNIYAKDPNTLYIITPAS